jgi:hypothetical protein
MHGLNEIMHTPNPQWTAEIWTNTGRTFECWLSGHAVRVIASNISYCARIAVLRCECTAYVHVRRRSAAQSKRIRKPAYESVHHMHAFMCNATYTVMMLPSTSQRLLTLVACRYLQSHTSSDSTPYSPLSLTDCTNLQKMFRWSKSGTHCRSNFCSHRISEDRQANSQLTSTRESREISRQTRTWTYSPPDSCVYTECDRPRKIAVARSLQYVQTVRKHCPAQIVEAVAL